jgi:hypothetical protein
MQFTKHIGKHGDRKVAIVYRTVPGEEHMALVCYPDTLKAGVHDTLMKVIESEPGQQAAELADALFRNLLPDGRPILQTFHKEGMIKKVPTNQIVVTPNATSHVRLDELNKIFDGFEAGDDAKKKMADLDANSGFVDPKANRINATDVALHAPVEALDDNALAANLVSQATNLMEEVARMQEQAYALNPSLRPVDATKKKVATKKKATPKSVTTNETSS